MHPKTGEYKLREQVRGELKKRRYITYTLLVLSLFYVSANLVLGDMGVLSYLEFRQKQVVLEKELQDIMERKESLIKNIKAYRENDFYKEKNARENFGLSGPDEYTFLYDKSEAKAK